MLAGVIIRLCDFIMTEVGVNSLTLVAGQQQLVSSLQSSISINHHDDAQDDEPHVLYASKCLDLMCDHVLSMMIVGGAGDRGGQGGAQHDPGGDAGAGEIEEGGGHVGRERETQEVQEAG